MKNYITKKMLITTVVLLGTVAFCSCQEKETFEELPKLGEVITDDLESPQSTEVHTASEGGIIVKYTYSTKNNLERKFELLIPEKKELNGKVGILKKKGIWEVQFPDGNITYRGIDNIEEEKLIQDLIQSHINEEVFESVDARPTAKIGDVAFKQRLEESIAQTGYLADGSSIDIQFVVTSKGTAKAIEVLNGDEDLVELYRGEVLKNIIEIMAQNEWEPGKKNGVKVNVMLNMSLEI